MKKNTPDERGSALLLTLGILSLALIVAMAFAFSARLNRQIAKVNADQTKARLLAESTLNLVVAAMMNEGDVYLPEASSLFTKVEDMPELAENLPALVLVKNLPAFFVSEGEDDSEYDLSNDTHILPVLGQFEWSLPEPEGSLPKPVYNTIEVDGETIGRVAFLVLEEGDKLDLNQMLSHSGKIPFVKKDQDRLASFTETDQTDGFLYDISAGEATVSEENTLRLGLQMQELRVASNYLAELPSGYNGTKAKWFSYTHLWRKLWGLETPLEPPSDAKRYTFFSGEDIEAWWHPGDNKEYHRFDLSSYEWRNSDDNFYNANYEIISANTGWSTMDGDTLVKSPDSPDCLHAATLTEFAEATSINNIPYLSQMVDRNGASVSKHVAANLVDYCDKDDFVTTDFNLDWSTTPPNPTPPTYCGLEKAAAVSEVGLEVVIERTDVSPGYNYKVKIQPTVDFVNIFSEAVPIGQGRLLIQGTLQIANNTTPADPVRSFSFDDAKFSVSDQGNIDENDSYTGKVQFILDTSVTDQSKTPYYPYYLLCSEDFAVITPGNIAPALEFTLKISKVVVQMDENLDDNKIYDVAYCEQNFDIVMLFPGADTVNKGLNFYASMEAEDPRCNHRSEFWKWTTYLGNTKFTMGAPPAGLSALLGQNGSVYDEEASVKFSTAYIRNAPPKSFWELGAIHRGEPMRTINLKKYTDPESESSTGTYQDGDAALLDQVKIGPLKYSRGKFNANSRNPLAWAELLRGIDLSAGYEDISYYDPADEDDPEGNYPPKPDFAGIAPSHSRAAVAAALASFGSTDREREALIGRTANLLTTRMDKYSALVIGQALQKIDLPEGFTMTPEFRRTLVNPTQIGAEWYSLLATQRILAHIVRDAWRNEYKIVQLQIIED